MKKRFQNILVWTRKKNGAVLLACAIILTVSLGTMMGCSAAKENTGDTSGQTNSSEQGTGAETTADNENLTDGMSYDEDTQANVSGGDSIGNTDNMIPAEDNTVSDRITLTIMKEGEPEEKQASLVVEDGYSLYLPDGEWQKNGEGIWQAAVNDKVRIWAECYDREDLNEQLQMESVMINGEFYIEGTDLTGTLTDADLSDIRLVQSSEEMMYAAKLHGDGDDVWFVFYCYPVEAEEGWGSELPVIADTFAVTVRNDSAD